MNLLHRWYCSSGHWSHTVERKLLPWVLADIDVGDQVLELGPGPGITTEVLRRRTAQLTCVEIDERLAARLTARLRDTNVRVLHGDATRLALSDASFSGVIACTMLHHVPSAELQDRIFREARRVLRPGGVFVGSDSISSRFFRMIHAFDTLVPVDPGALGGRLEAAGFCDPRIDVVERAFRFRARAG